MLGNEVWEKNEVDYLVKVNFKEYFEKIIMEYFMIGNNENFNEVIEIWKIKIEVRCYLIVKGIWKLKIIQYFLTKKLLHWYKIKNSVTKFQRICRC